MHGLGAAARRRFFGNPRRRHDSYDYAALLRSCVNLQTLKQIHQQIVAAGYARNPFLAAKLVALYTDLSVSGMEDARRAFDCADTKDVLLWNVLIRGYAAGDSPGEALAAYKLMRRGGGDTVANQYTFPFLLKACATVHGGAAVHGEICKMNLAGNLFVGNALIAFYARCGQLESARQMFEEMPDRDAVTWNSLIAGHAQREKYSEALHLFREMMREKEKPDHVTLVAVLPACAKLTAAREGMWVHGYAVKEGMLIDVALGSGLVTMYASCGRLDIARDVFDRMPHRNVVAWGAMIKGYGMHGRAREAIEMMEEMMEDGVLPDGICFLSLLSACAHAGMVEEGIKVFDAMEKFGVEKGELHYGCMVDLLGRAGMVAAAAEMAETAGKEGWGALLGACRVHGKVEVAAVAAERMVEIEPGNGGRYAAIARAYEGAGRGEDAARVRVMMREKGVRKTAGCSWVELDGMLHGFGVGDESHARTVEIYGLLHGLTGMTKIDDDDDDDDD